jgi:integrase/recombinase XerC
MLPAVLEPAATPLVPTLGDAELLRAFLDSFSERTRRAYDADLRDFAKHLGAASAGHAVGALLAFGQGLANLQVLGYRTAMTQRALASSTIARRMAALKSVVRMGRMLGRVNWQLEIRAPKVEAYRDTAGPGLDGWRRLLAAAGQREDAKGLRDLAIVRLLHDLALRREEVCQLNHEHIDFKDGQPATVWVLGKGQSVRIPLALPSPTSYALLKWLRVRGDKWGPLFHPMDHAGRGRLSGRSVARVVAALGRAAALPRGAHPHALRHEAITTALDRTNGDVRKVQRFSRHKNVQTLIHYDDRRRDPSAAIADLVAED